MIKRTLSTIALWAIVFGTLAFGGATGGIVLLAIFSVLAQYEFQVLLEKSGLPPWKLPTLLIGFFIVLEWGLHTKFLALVWPLAAIGLIVGALGCAQNPAALHRLAGSVLAIIYVPVQLQFYALLMLAFGVDAARGGGVGLAVWVIAVAKFTDVGGYLVGSQIGRNKLAPSISPGKTWEGVAGGLVLAMLVGLGSWKLAPNFLPPLLTSTRALWLPLPIGIAAIISDLSESAFKRRAGMKDSGRCIPGIGGALDLADSLLLAAPVAFFLLEFLAA